MGPTPLMRNLEHLTGPEAAGRLSGTGGARLAADYLARELSALGLAPAGDEGYFQRVEVPAARVTGQVKLSIGGVAYRHRADFAEMTHLSSGGSVQSDLIVVRDGDPVGEEELRGKVVLIPNRPADFDITATVAAASDLQVAALLIEWGEPKWFHKTLFGSAQNRIPVLRINQNLANSLATASGAPVDIDLPLAMGSLACQNVIGLWPGADTTRTVALTAHYDHVGDDPGGERFPGAADNASGVVTILEAVRGLVSRNERLPFNLLVGFLTGEESGLWGAKHLAAHTPVPLTSVINLDGIGMEPSLRSMRLGYTEPGHWLADLAADLLEHQGIDVQWQGGHDDSVAFQAAGLPALGLGQMLTEPLGGGFHSPDDTSDLLHVPVLEQGAETLVSLIHQLANRQVPTAV